jgi:hypothetical protein
MHCLSRQVGVYDDLELPYMKSTPGLLRLVVGIAARGVLFGFRHARECCSFASVRVDQRAYRYEEEEPDPHRGCEGNQHVEHGHILCRTGGKTRKAHRGLTSGNKIVSRIPSPVSAISNRSMPIPMPPDGGIACSIAVRKSSSTRIASGSPLAASNA